MRYPRLPWVCAPQTSSRVDRYDVLGGLVLYQYGAHLGPVAVGKYYAISGLHQIQYGVAAVPDVLHLLFHSPLLAVLGDGVPADCNDDRLTHMFLLTVLDNRDNGPALRRAAAPHI